jgi:hypothetical protein
VVPAGAVAGVVVRVGAVVPAGEVAVEKQRRLTRIAGLLRRDVGVSHELVNVHCIGRQTG